MRTHILIAALALIVSACASHHNDRGVSSAQYEQQQSQAEQFSMNEGTFMGRSR